jgi:hypothetical protein
VDGKAGLIVSDFIETYENAISPELCQALIERFEASDRRQPGRTGHGVDKAKKDSTDLCLTGLPEWLDLHNELQDAALKHFMQYLRKYPYLLTGPLGLVWIDAATGQQRPITADDVLAATDPELGAYVFRVFRPGNLILQKYVQNAGGYHYFHSEIYPRDEKCEALHRVLLFMFYLNSVEQGGETEFLYQQRLLTPERGAMVIAPGGFTHTHKGHVPRSSDKYIVTSWIMFQRAEQIYRKQ